MDRSRLNPQTLSKVRRRHSHEVIAFQDKLTAPVELLHGLVNKESHFSPLHLVGRSLGDLPLADFANGDGPSLEADLINQGMFSDGDEVSLRVCPRSPAALEQIYKFYEGRLIHIRSQAGVRAVPPQYCQQVWPKCVVKTGEGINVLRRLEAVSDYDFKIRLGSTHRSALLHVDAYQPLHACSGESKKQAFKLFILVGAD